jgi:hypothetical protein
MLIEKWHEISKAHFNVKKERNPSITLFFAFFIVFLLLTILIRLQKE